MQRQVMKPDILEYPFQSTFRVYLDDWFRWRKATYGAPSMKGRAYSHRLFSRRVGLKNTGLLANVIQGRQKLSATQVEHFLRELALSEVRANVFRALVTHDQAAEDVRQKEEALTALPEDPWRSSLLEWSRHCYAEARARLRALMTFTLCRALSEGEVKWLTSWFYVAIREMATCRGFQDDPDWIADALRPQVDREHVAEAGLCRRGDADRERVCVASSSTRCSARDLEQA